MVVSGSKPIPYTCDGYRHVWSLSASTNLHKIFFMHMKQVNDTLVKIMQVFQKGIHGYMCLFILL